MGKRRGVDEGVGEEMGVLVGAGDGPVVAVLVRVALGGRLVAVGEVVKVGIGVFVGGWGKGVKVGVGIPGELYS